MKLSDDKHVEVGNNNTEIAEQPNYRDNGVVGEGVRYHGGLREPNRSTVSVGGRRLRVGGPSTQGPLLVE